MRYGCFVGVSPDLSFHIAELVRGTVVGRPISLPRQFSRRYPIADTLQYDTNRAKPVASKVGDGVDVHARDLVR